MPKYCLIILAILLLFPFISPTSAFAQIPNFGIATTYQITDKDLVDGDILSISTGKNLIERTTKEYDSKMYGVYLASPKAVYRIPEANFPVLRNGEALVNVSNIAGPIKKGDYITSSPIIGKGQKATEVTGYILGIALSDFDGKNGSDVNFSGKNYKMGKVNVAIGIGPASPIQIKGNGGLLGAIETVVYGFLLNLQTSRDTRWIRYLLAAIVTIFTIYINFRTFGRNITHGIEAIGRNPLAKVSIQSMIILNIGLIAFVTLAGIGLALVIISF